MRKKITWLIGLCMAGWLGAGAQDPAITGINPDATPIDIGTTTTIRADFVNGSTTAFAPTTRVIWTINLPPAIEVVSYTFDNVPVASLVDVTITPWNTDDGQIVQIISKPGVAFPGGNNPGGANEIRILVVGKKVTARQPMSIQAESDPAVGTNSPTNDNVGNHIMTLAILPLQLTSLTAIPDGCGARLDWATAREVNVSHFEVEYSADGTSFATVASVDAGSTNGQYSYRYGQGTGFYRLKMVDKDGKASYSGIQPATSTCGGAAIALYPNPAHAKLTVAGLVAGQKLALCDGKGSIVRLLAVSGNTREVSLTGLAAGSYLLQVIENGKVVSSKKFIKQ